MYKLENCSPVANVKDKRFVDLTGSPELASLCSNGYVPPNTQANMQWSVKTFNSWMDWRIKDKLEARLRFGSGSMFSFSSHSSSCIPLSCNKLVITWPLVRICRILAIMRPSGITSILCQYLAYGTRGHVITNTYSVLYFDCITEFDAL